MSSSLKNVKASMMLDMVFLPYAERTLFDVRRTIAGVDMNLLGNTAIDRVCRTHLRRARITHPIPIVAVAIASRYRDVLAVCSKYGCTRLPPSYMQSVL